MRLILIRHGETEWNTQHRAQGRTDIPLNERGRAQAQALGNHFAGETIDLVLSSPLSRAYETAKAVADAAGAPIKTAEDLTEIQFGVWEGLSFDDIRKNYPELMKQWRECPYSCDIPNAESPEEVMLRVVPYLKKVVEENPGKTIAVVSHTLPLKVALASFMGLPFDNIHVFRLDNTGYSELEFREDGKCILTNLNVSTHLKGVGAQWQTLR